MKTKPIVPWMGGKRRLVSQLMANMPKNQSYVELFARGAALVATDTLGQMHGKLQAQINNGSKVEWIDAQTIGRFGYAFSHGTIRDKPAKLEFAKIDRNIGIRGFLAHTTQCVGKLLKLCKTFARDETVYFLICIKNFLNYLVAHHNAEETSQII